MRRKGGKVKKRTRQTRLALGQRKTPEWVESWMHLRPSWNCPQSQDEEAFRRFIFMELDRRIGDELDELANAAQSDETATLFEELVQSGWKPSATPPRKAHRPKVDPILRQLLPAEDAARLVTTIREVFEDYWDQWNRGRPSAEELAADYVGIAVSRVRTRLKRGKKRRPSS